MYLNSSDAIILRTHRLGEADKIVIFLSRKNGLVRGVARGARRLKSRFGAGLEPFTKVSISWAEREVRELVSIRQVEIEKSYFELSGNPEAVTALERMCAAALTFAPPAQPDERLFRMVSACFEALSRRPEASEAIIVYFELWLLKLSGFLPELSLCGGCGGVLEFCGGPLRFRPDGQIFCASCAAEAGEILHREALQWLMNWRRQEPLGWAERFLSEEAAVRRAVASFSGRLLTGVAGQRMPATS